ncbi:hypothetical protein PPERSA_06871 [Pseudocohnilembus persalinus]|uniref:Cyclic nucleotide-binding protein n=1 Tax=Pseudocohnilembus persalinus TaxID=266149 RepID=A0A0V0QTJ9_PSEPJ|nr:hypothetical protein PPERSA_06871 [Pseudocohnilembus persalinus]|eukprot:KRX05237.1 hypothetical protein PPERSA_06871 [Pseudocohnilembus persalinus]
MAVIEIDFLGSNKTWLHTQNLVDKEWQDRYIQSYYWAVSTMVTILLYLPETNFETLYAIFSLFLMTGVYGYVLNTIGIILNEKNKKKQDYKKQREMLIRFFKKRKFPEKLKERITLYLEFQHQQLKEKNEEEEKLIRDKLSNQLQKVEEHYSPDEIIINQKKSDNLYVIAQGSIISRREYKSFSAYEIQQELEEIVQFIFDPQNADPEVLQIALYYQEMYMELIPQNPYDTNEMVEELDEKQEGNFENVSKFSNQINQSFTNTNQSFDLKSRRKMSLEQRLTRKQSTNKYTQKMTMNTGSNHHSHLQLSNLHLTQDQLNGSFYQQTLDNYDNPQSSLTLDKSYQKSQYSKMKRKTSYNDTYYNSIQPKTNSQLTSIIEQNERELYPVSVKPNNVIGMKNQATKNMSRNLDRLQSQNRKLTINRKLSKKISIPPKISSQLQLDQSQFQNFQQKPQNGQQFPIFMSYVQQQYNNNNSPTKTFNPQLSTTINTFDNSFQSLKNTSNQSQAQHNINNNNLQNLIMQNKVGSNGEFMLAIPHQFKQRQRDDDFYIFDQLKTWEYYLPHNNFWNNPILKQKQEENDIQSQSSSSSGKRNRIQTIDNKSQIHFSNNVYYIYWPFLLLTSVLTIYESPFH